jgi:hypothetical protein
MKKMKLLLLCLVTIAIGAKAQIGYQISLLNTATGEPRANETVTVSVTISNNEGESFYSETKSATTNDFGVLSLSIGNADTFKNVNLSKMPFFIEVTANSVSIGKSQILNVPVAEVAKRLGGELTEDMLVGTWVREIKGYDLNMSYYSINHGEQTVEYQYKQWSHDKHIYIFREDGTGTEIKENKYWEEGEKGSDGYPIEGEHYDDQNKVDFTYYIDGNDVYRYYEATDRYLNDSFIPTYMSPNYIYLSCTKMFTYNPHFGVLLPGYTKQ